MLRSGEMYRVRIVHSGGERNQTSDVLNASKSSLTESYTVTNTLPGSFAIVLRSVFA